MTLGKISVRVVFVLLPHLCLLTLLDYAHAAVGALWTCSLSGLYLHFVVLVILLLRHASSPLLPASSEGCIRGSIGGFFALLLLVAFLLVALLDFLSVEYLLP